MHEITPGKWYSGVDPGEVLRYSGVPDANACGDKWVEEAVLAVNQVGQAASPKRVTRECAFSSSDGLCRLDSLTFRSVSLAEHLKGCDRAVLFAATLGSGVDTLIRRCSAVSMSRAVILQGAAAALTELYCDAECESLEGAYAQAGYYLRPRFSPGYGDFPLECQQTVIELLGAHKYAGIAVSSGGQMTPMKSVTAVIGLSRERGSAEGSCASGKCAGCPNTSCPFRRA